MNGIYDANLLALETAMQRLAKVGGWQIETVNSGLYWTDEVYRIHELELDITPNVEAAINFYHPDDRARVLACIEDALSKGISFTVEARLITPSGKVIHTRSIGDPIFENGKLVRIVGAFQDISEHTQLNLEAQRSRDSYQKIAHSARAMIWRAEPGTHRFTSITQNCKEISGFSEREWLSPHFWQQHIHPEDREATLAKKRQLLENGQDHVLEYRMLCANGSEIWVSDSISAVQKDGEVVELVGVLLDTTSLVRARNESLTYASRLESSYKQTLQAMATTIEQRDPYTAGHMNRVAQLSQMIALRMGLEKRAIDGLIFGATIHDIGKISLPAEILNRPGKLTNIEYQLIKTHAELGYEIVKNIDFPWPVKDLVRSHHERLDGSGYPDGLKGDQISIETRILSVADVVEAFSSHRPYRPAKRLAEARQFILEQSGIQFDERVVNACVDIIDAQEFEPS